MKLGFYKTETGRMLIDVGDQHAEMTRSHALILLAFLVQACLGIQKTALTLDLDLSKRFINPALEGGDSYPTKSTLRSVLKRNNKHRRGSWLHTTAKEVRYKA